MVQLIIQERHFLLIFVRTTSAHRKVLLQNDYETPAESIKSDRSQHCQIQDCVDPHRKSDTEAWKTTRASLGRQNTGLLT